MDSQNKVCAGPCGLSKPLSEFPSHYRARDGRMSLCKTCYVEKTRRREVEALTEHYRKMLQRTGKQPAKRIPMPADVKQEEKPKPRCTCKPKRYGPFIAHSALCMIFLHNQLDGIRRSSSLDEEATKYGG